MRLIFVLVAAGGLLLDQLTKIIAVRWLDPFDPPVLLGGNHAEIMKWRRRQQLAATANKRPDLLDEARRAGQLNKADEQFLADLQKPVEQAPPT